MNKTDIFGDGFNMKNFTLTTNNDLVTIISELSFQQPFRYTVGVIWALLTFFGIVGNGLVIIIAITYRKLNDITSCYIFNLAITDLLFVLFCIPFTTFMIVDGNWFLGVTLCKLNQFISRASVQSTCLTLTAMTIQRCHLIIKNKTVTQNASNINRRRRVVLITTVIIWIVSLLINFPYLILYTVVITPDDQTYQCGIDLQGSEYLKNYLNIASILSVTTSYIIPLFIIVLSYARLLSHLARNQRRLAKFTHKHKDKKLDDNSKLIKTSTASTVAKNGKPISVGKPAPKARSENKRRKVTKMVAVVTFNFGICWLPTHIIGLIYYVYVNNEQLKALHFLFKITANTLSYLTPVINPCLYAFYNENFRIPLIDLCNKITYKPNQTRLLNNNNVNKKNNNNLTNNNKQNLARENV